jgi:hypothetical protein
MPEPLSLAGLLLVAGALIGAGAASHPVLFPVWSAPRDERLRIVGAHRLAWTMLNAGFLIATVATAGGLAALAVAEGDDPGVVAALAAVLVSYAVAGGLWCAVVAIRSLTTPALADLAARGADTEPSETLLNAALWALFGAFTLVTGVALLALAGIVGVGGIVAVPIAVLAAVVAGIVIAAYLVTGDSVPAVLYLPTILIGIALLAGWT